MQRQNPLILIVDDSPVIHKIVKRALQEKYTVVSYTSGSEALSQIEKISPELILLDVEMPELNGFETIEQLKKIPSLAQVPIIFLTAKNDVDFELKALELGAVDYINKPFSNLLLQKRIEIHLSHATHTKNLSNYNENLKQMVTEQTRTIKELQSAIVFTLADLVEMRDNSTGGHVFRTQAYFKLILEYLQENNIYQDIINIDNWVFMLEASQLHDVGKVAIPDAILCKPGRLTVEEFEIMKTHTSIGFEAISRAMSLTTDKEFLNFAAEVALTHHEKWDGNGYPNGIVGDKIPVTGRIMAIVDVYDALVSKRHYKEAMSHEKSMSILKEGSGAHFDPTLINAVIAIQDKFEAISKNQN